MSDLTGQRSVGGNLTGVLSEIHPVYRIDTELNKEGYAADAKATGDAIAQAKSEAISHSDGLTAADVGARPNDWMPSLADLGAAPSGYGLGGQCRWAQNDLNFATESGFWAWQSTTANTPFEYGSLLVLNRNNERFTQIGFDPNMVGHREMAVRHRTSDGTWSMWEYINPPMKLGVEYPTVERYRTKRVYTKAIDLGELPNASSKTVSHNIANMGACISAVGTTSDGSSFGYVLPSYNTSAANGQTGFYVTKTAVMVATSANWTGYNAVAILKYTKTTD